MVREWTPIVVFCILCITSLSQTEQIFRRTFHYHDVPLGPESNAKVFISRQMAMSSSELLPQESKKVYTVSNEGSHNTEHHADTGEKVLKEHSDKKKYENNDKKSNSQSKSSGQYSQGKKEHKNNDKKEASRGHESSGGDGKKGHDFSKKGHHKKSKNAEGYVNEWTKEESGRAQKFYDDFDLKSQNKTYDDHDSFHNAQDQSHKEGDREERYKDHNEHGKENYHNEEKSHGNHEEKSLKSQDNENFKHTSEHGLEGDYTESENGETNSKDDHEGAHSQPEIVVVPYEFGTKLPMGSSGSNVSERRLKPRTYRRRNGTDRVRLVKRKRQHKRKPRVNPRRKNIPLKTVKKIIPSVSPKSKPSTNYTGFKNIDKPKKLPIKKYNPLKYKKAKKKPITTNLKENKPVINTEPFQTTKIPASSQIIPIKTIKSKSEEPTPSVHPAVRVKKIKLRKKYITPKKPIKLKKVTSIKDKIEDQKKSANLNINQKDPEFSETDSSKTLVPIPVIKKKGQQVSSVSSKELKPSETSKHHGKGGSSGKSKGSSSHASHEQGFHEAHGEKGSKGGFKERGYKDKHAGDHSKKYISKFQDKGKKDYSGEEHKKEYGGKSKAGKKANKGHSFGTKGHHKKGHSDRGFKDVHHKFEYAVNKKFFDDYEDHDHHKKYDDFDAYFDKHVKSSMSNHDAHTKQFHDEFDKSGFFDDEFFHDDIEGMKAHYGHHDHHDHHSGYAKKGGFHKDHDHGYHEHGGHGHGGHGHGGHGHGGHGHGGHGHGGHGHGGNGHGGHGHRGHGHGGHGHGGHGHGGDGH